VAGKNQSVGEHLADMALIVAGRLLLGASCIGFIAAGACLLGIDQQAP
jgi:hypothetical protein